MCNFSKVNTRVAAARANYGLCGVEHHLQKWRICKKEDNTECGAGVVLVVEAVKFVLIQCARWHIASAKSSEVINTSLTLPLCPGRR